MDCQKLTGKEKRYIIDNISNYSQPVARYLGLNETAIEEIGNEKGFEKGGKLLTRWEQTDGCQATKQRMIEALEKSGRKDMADELKNSIKEESTNKIPDISATDFKSLVKGLKTKYRSLRMPQPLGTKALRVSDSFINQEMAVTSSVEDDLKIKIEQIFENLDELKENVEMPEMKPTTFKERIVKWIATRKKWQILWFSPIISFIFVPLLIYLHIILHIITMYFLFLGYGYLISNTEPKRSETAKELTTAQTVEEEKVTRILVEGDAGYGKSTLATKLAVDWAKGKDYMANRFDLVFLLPLKDIRRSIEQAVKVECDSILTNGIDEKTLKKLFGDNRRKVLFILDGYDEINDSDLMNSITNTLCRIKFLSSSYLVTSRRGVFSDKETRTIRFIHSEQVNEIPWTAKLLLKGFSKAEQKEFLKKYYKENYDNLKSKLKRFIQKEKKVELFSCPFFLFWLVNMLETNELENVNTKTSFFKVIFNYVARKILVAENKIFDYVDIFECENNEVLKSFKSELKELGQIGLESNLKNITFNENQFPDLKDKILMKCGLFAKVKTANEEICYQPVHKSLLEFMAAFSLCESTQDNKDEFIRRIRNLVKNGFVPSEFSLFYPFVAGLLEDNICWLFEALEPWAVLFHTRKKGMISIFVELRNISDNVIQSLQNFISPICSLQILNGYLTNYFNSQFHKQLLKFSLSKGILSCIDWNTGLPLPRDADFSIKKFDYIELNTSNAIPSQPTIWSSIKCKELSIYFSVDIDNEQTWENYISAFLKLKADNHHITLEKCSIDDCTKVFDEMKSGRWKEIFFQSIRLINCPLQLNHVKTITHLIQTRRLTKGLHLQYRKSFEHDVSEKLIESLWNTVVVSSLPEFSFDNPNPKIKPTFDLSGIENRQIPFDYMKFFGHFALSNTPNATVRVYILHLIPFYAKLDSLHADQIITACTNFVMQCTTLKKFSCNVKIFSNVLFSTVFHSVDEIMLTVKENFSIPELDSAINNLPSLKVLALNLTHFDVTSSKCDIPNQMEDFLSSIFKHRQLRLLSLIYIYSANLLLELLKLVKNVKPSGFTLNSLEIMLKPDVDSDKMVQVYDYLNYLMIEKHLEKVAFSFYDLPDSYNLNLTNSFPEKEFCFLSEIDGHCDDHSFYFEENFRNLMIINDRVVIKAKKTDLKMDQ